MDLLVYLDRFDPITAEQIDLISALGPMILLPNIDDTFLLYRTHILSFLFPLYTTFDWLPLNSVCVDTRKHDIILTYLTTHYNVIFVNRLLGSKTIPHCLQHDKVHWYCHNSNHRTLNRKVVSHMVIDNMFVKQFIDQKTANDYVSRSQLWAGIKNNPFGSASVIKRERNIVYETLIPNASPLFDIINGHIMELVFKYLNDLHTQLYDNVVSHGDFSVMNLLWTGDRLVVIDYDRVQKYDDKEMLLRDYYQLLSSMTFYGSRLGKYIDRDYWKGIGDRIYTVKDRFSKEVQDRWISHFMEHKN